ncbi:MAG TPA: SMC-Scp complex subunit ScpB [Spirochaetota bacterium]|nr:SMC-Scp complex subunit ScpB [Spirochaetota bacterium]HPJ33779.1 SMC-Scp complex subunit ScpB [Spirochaetota bacterium]
MGESENNNQITDDEQLDEQEQELVAEDEADREHYLKSLFEAVFFLSNEPVPISFFVKNFMIDPTQTKIIIDSLVDEYEERDGGIRLAELSNGYQFVTNARFAEQLRHALGLRKRESLSKGMLETLAIIAYKQPIVLADIDELRGASSRMMVANLMKRNLVKPVGRKELPGRPLAYGTTDEFLRYFGLNKLSDLPKLSEIKEFSIDLEQ